jgi:cobalt-zinc-cadmium efflux system outer membrane protein
LVFEELLSPRRPPAWRVIAIGLLSLGLGGAGLAEETPRRLTLADALGLAERQGFDILLADAAVRGAEGDLTAARHLVNPLFSGSYLHSTDVPLDGAMTSAHGYSLALADQGSLEGIVSGKRGLRVEEAESALWAARSNREDALRLLRFQVAQAFYGVLAAEASEKVEIDVSDSFARTLELVQVRYHYGAVSEVDVDRVETAKLEAEQAVAAARALVLQARATLAFLLGGIRSDFEISGSLDSAPPAGLTSDTKELLAEAAAARADVRAARAGLKRAETALALARRERLPDVILSASYGREGPDAAPITPPTLGLGASFEIPLFTQKQGEIARAESDRSAAQVTLDRISASVTEDVLSAKAAYAAAQEQVNRMNDRLLDRARRARDLVRLQYRAGAISLIDLLDAERTALAVEIEYRQDLYALRAAVAQLETAMGRGVSP